MVLSAWVGLATSAQLISPVILDLIRLTVDSSCHIILSDSESSFLGDRGWWKESVYG